MPDRRFAILLACFFVSGVAALIYETAWTREFSFIFGTSELAVATVLGGYMAGLAIGAALAARWGPRIRRPILAYALLELGIGLAALGVPLAITGSRGLYRAIFGGGLHLADEGGLLRALFFLVTSVAILIVPTALMGATLPLLTRHAVRRDDQVGPRVGVLYTVNTFGAVCGTLVTAFLLLQHLGLRGSVLVAIGCNLLVFVGGAILARGASPVEPQPSKPAEPGRLGRSRVELILPVMLLSGAASFAYEVMWTRLLSQILGASVYAFATMLATFLTGIALGAWIASRIAKQRRRAALVFGWAQIGTAVLSIIAFLVLDWIPAIAAQTGGTGVSGLLVNTAVAGVVLLPATLCIGATFPLAVRMLAPSATAATAATARVYAWNTAGALIGAVGAGFFLIPALGFSGMASLAAGVNLALALVVAATLAEPRSRAVWAATAGIVLLLIVRPPTPWKLLRSTPFEPVPVSGEAVFYAVGRGATVLAIERDGGWELRTNGLREAQIRPPGSRAAEFTLINWLAAQPSLARPDARRMLVIGLGGGVVLESVPPSVASIDVVEIEPEVIEANRAVADKRAHDPLSDPRVRIVVNDARGGLILSEGRYDLIVSQPSHPWTAAASHLFSQEFFELVREHLVEDGVLAQWIGLPYVDEALLKCIVATLVDVFPHVRVYRPVPMAVILLASGAELDIETTSADALAAFPDAYARLGISCPEDVAAALVLDEASAQRFSRGARINTDDRNVLAMRSPFLIRRDRARTRREIDAALKDYDPLVEPTPGLDRYHIVRRLLGSAAPGRAARVAEATRDPAERALARALVEVAAQRPQRAAGLVEAALRLRPGLRTAWIARALGEHRSGRVITTEQPGVESPLLDSDLAVVEGWRSEAAGDWNAVADLETRLAHVTGCDPFFVQAMNLRVAWRMAEDDPALALQAMELLDVLVAEVKAPAYLVRRARAAHRAGQRAGAIRTLAEIVRRLQPTPAHRALARRSLQIIGSIETQGTDPILTSLRGRFEQILER